MFLIVPEFREELEGPAVQVRRGHNVGAFSSFSAFAHAMNLIIAKHKKGQHQKLSPSARAEKETLDQQ